MSITAPEACRVTSYVLSAIKTGFVPADLLLQSGILIGGRRIGLLMYLLASVNSLLLFCRYHLIWEKSGMKKLWKLSKKICKTPRTWTNEESIGLTSISTARERTQLLRSC